MRYSVSYRYGMDSFYNFLTSASAVSCSTNKISGDITVCMATPSSLVYVYETEMKFL